jgi:HSP20 family protein
MLMISDPLRHLDRLSDKGFSGIGAMDAYRNGDVITVQFDLPGVDPNSIDLQIERGELRVSAQRRIDRPEGARYLVRERTEATVTRRVMLGDVVDVDHVDAEFADGLLTLRVPLHDHAKARKIDVRHLDAKTPEQPAISVEVA